MEAWEGGEVTSLITCITNQLVYILCLHSLLFCSLFNNEIIHRDDHRHDVRSALLDVQGVVSVAPCEALPCEEGVDALVPRAWRLFKPIE